MVGPPRLAGRILGFALALFKIRMRAGKVEKDSRDRASCGDVGPEFTRKEIVDGDMVSIAVDKR